MRCSFPGGPVQAATRFNRQRTLERGGLLSRDWAGAAGHNMFCGQSHVLKEPENENRVFVINPEIAFLELILSTTKVPIPCPVVLLSPENQTNSPLREPSSDGDALVHASFQPRSGGHQPRSVSPADGGQQRWPLQKTDCQAKGDPESVGCSQTAVLEGQLPPSPSLPQGRRTTLHDRTRHPHVLLLFAKGI